MSVPVADQEIACPECGEMWPPRKMAGHQNKHRNERKRADSSNTPSDNVIGEPVREPGETPSIAHFTPGSKPKVAGVITPYMAMVAFAVSQRNAYDGAVVSAGIPNLVEALDAVAQQNEQLYKLLQALQSGNNPNLQLVVAALAIIVPILANHRPDSNVLRGVTGALSYVPGTSIPPLPPKPVRTEEPGDDIRQPPPPSVDDTIAQAKAVYDSMTDEERGVFEENINALPADLLDRIVDFQTNPQMAAHPEFLEPEPITGEVMPDATQE